MRADAQVTPNTQAPIESILTVPQSRQTAPRTIVFDQQIRGTQPRLAERPLGLDCPTCGEPRAWRSRRKGIIEWLSSRLFGRYPFRCRSCGDRFSIWLPREHRT